MSEIKKYYRSIDHLEQSEEFKELLQREFPGVDPQNLDAPSRRRFLQLLGASAALATATGCRWEKQEVLTANERALNRLPGVPQHFATAMELGGAARPLVMTSYEGRPIKAEGNDQHAESSGASGAFAQASVLGLYDPDRARNVVQKDGDSRQNISWSEFQSRNKPVMDDLLASRGKGLAVLCEPSSSPTQADLKRRLLETLPNARWHEYAPVNDDLARAGSTLAFGSVYKPQYRLDQTDVLLCLDADLLDSHPGSLRHSREFGARRDPDLGGMIRMYAVESRHTLTGSNADHRLPLRSDQIGAFLSALMAELGVAGASDNSGLGEDSKAGPFLEALAGDLNGHKGRCLVAVGEHQPALVQAMGHRLNEWLENSGKTVAYVQDEIQDRPDGNQSLRELTTAINAGEVDSLWILGGNPAYDCPADIAFGLALLRVRNSYRLGLYEDETSQRCVWHLPMAHFLESWGDGRAWDGSLLLTQPTIAPLYGGKSAIEVLALISFDELTDGHDLVRRTFDRLVDTDEATWRKALHDGFARDSAGRTSSPKVKNLAALSAGPTSRAIENGSLELVFHADASVYDGRFGNNGWLQELPDPMSRMSWDNAAQMGPATAAKLGVTTGDLVRLKQGGHELEVVAYVMPGVAAGSVSLALGYGRTEAGVIGGLSREHVDPVGFDGYRMRGSASPWIAGGLTVETTGKTYPLATVQEHHMIDTVGMEGREERLDFLIRETDAAHYKEEPDFAKKPDEHGPALVSLWDEHPYEGNKWGMAIDMTKCTGCNGCVIACQAENNIPIVGKEQVATGREMHWLRIDRYFSGDVDDPQVASQPMTCQHCENAPCEEVCPVGATMHSSEGLNDMVYNRCVGTRYCSNNCPFKVRRFNYFNYHLDLKEEKNEVRKMVYNPAVTVRARGVMEKCTYCTHKISAARVLSKNEKRDIRDGEIQPACAKSCAADAISFGNLNDPNARVSKEHASKRSYLMLAMLNIKARTSYLARITNPNPALAKPEAKSAH